MSATMYDELPNNIPMNPIEHMLNLKGVTCDQLEYKGSVKLILMSGIEIAEISSIDDIPEEFIFVKDKPGYPKTHGKSFFIIGRNAIRHCGFSTEISQSHAS